LKHLQTRDAYSDRRLGDGKLCSGKDVLRRDVQDVVTTVAFVGAVFGVSLLSRWLFIQRLCASLRSSDYLIGYLTNAKLRPRDIAWVGQLSGDGTVEPRRFDNII
jgi:hypothetical protein